MEGIQAGFLLLLEPKKILKIKLDILTFRDRFGILYPVPMCWDSWARI